MSSAPVFFSYATPRISRKASALVVNTLIILAALALPALFPAMAQAQQMKLLTPNTGWVSNNGHLYWTADAGSHWADITPVTPGMRRLAVAVQSVFFLNTREGWAIVSHPETIVPLTEKAVQTRKTLYDIAQTADGGRTWSFLPLTHPALPEWEQVAQGPPGDMFFLDSLHGWLVMTMQGGAAFAPGKLLATDDGGRNWNWVNGPGTIGRLLFTSTQVGWLAGGPGGGNLYVTRNGGGSWEEMNLKTELHGKAADCGVIGPPHFTDESHGFLAGGCMGQSVVAFATSDAGRTWKAIKRLSESQTGGDFPVAIADSTLIVPTGVGPKAVQTAAVPLHGESESPVVVSRNSALGLSFADSSHGFALSIEGRLLFTADGGATWKDASPWPLSKASSVIKAPASIGTEAQGEATSPATSASISPLGPGGGGNVSHTSVHLGFDKCFGKNFTEAQPLNHMQARRVAKTLTFNVCDQRS